MAAVSNTIDPIATGIRMIEETRHDGHPFGLPPGCADDAHVLAIDDDGVAKIHRVDGGIAGPNLATIAAARWLRVADVAIADFNRRLAAKGMPAGRFPRPGGRVTLHPCFGRELQLAMLIGGDEDRMADEALDAWSGLSGIWRLRLWRLLRAGNSVVTDVENRDRLRAEAMASAAARRSAWCEPG